MKIIQKLAGIFLLSVSLNAYAQSQTVQNNMQYNHMVATGNSSNRPIFYASSKYITQKLNAKDIKGVDLTSISLCITPTDKNEVSLRLPENFTQLVQTEVIDNKLRIRFKDHVEVHYNEMELCLPYRYLEDLRITGSGSIFLSKELKTDHLNVSISGSGNFSATGLECAQKLNMHITGSGNISCSSIQATDITCRINGSGNITCPQIESGKYLISVNGSGNVSSSQVISEKCTLRISGSGNISILDLYSESFTGNISGSGNLSLKGETRKAVFLLHGSGDIHAEDCTAQDVKVYCTGTGKVGSSRVYCRAEQTLDCEIRQGGEVFYKGNPHVTFSNDAPKKL